LHPDDKALLAGAAWWYRPESVRLMLEVGFDPHVTGAHRSTPLDRASFHGYADIAWDTGHPRDHARTIKLLLAAGSPLDPTILPTGNDELDAVVRAWLKK